jgi:hypothetical protein
MEQKTTWFHYAIIFVLGMAVGSLSLAAAPGGSEANNPPVVSR